MPDEVQEWLPRGEVLSYEEILRVMRVGVGLGIKKVRITGGEPLTRRDMLNFMRELGKVSGLEQIGLSTNGTLLASLCSDDSGRTYAEDLKESGVQSLNLSLDTLDKTAYEATTGRDYLSRAIEGIEAAQGAGFEQIKLNSVLMRGTNDHEIGDLVEFAYARGLLLRFIELMPVSTTHVLTEENFLSTGEARRNLEEVLGELTPDPEFRTNGPATYYRVPGRDQRIGFIGAMTNLHFCENCNKLRLTCDGKLRPCLGSHLEFDMKAVLRDEEATDEDVARFFKEVVARKPKEHEFRDNYQPGRRMIAIGG
jgi:cyclic pyranopterin phosphate synthase